MCIIFDRCALWSKKAAICVNKKATFFPTPALISLNVVKYNVMSCYSSLFLAFFSEYPAKFGGDETSDSSDPALAWLLIETDTEREMFVLNCFIVTATQLLLVLLMFFACYICCLQLQNKKKVIHTTATCCIDCKVDRMLVYL